MAIHSYHLEEATNSGVSVMVFSACYEVKGDGIFVLLGKIVELLVSSWRKAACIMCQVGDEPLVSCIELVLKILW